LHESKQIPALSLYDPGNSYLPTLGAYNRSTNHYGGKMDEVRIWNLNRSVGEIRENMHLTLTGSETGLITYWQFNEGSGTHLENYGGGEDGTLFNMTDNSWVASTVAIGGGVSNTQAIGSPGIIDFTGTGIQMNFSLAEHKDTVVVTRIDSTPNILPLLDTIYDSQYWVVNKFGRGAFNTDIQFTVEEDISNYDQEHPDKITLCKRASTSEKPWYYDRSADNANATTDMIRFADISSFSQFSIGKGLITDIVVDPDSLTFSRIASTESVTDSFEIINIGTDTLFVTSICNNLPDYVLSSSSCTLLSGESIYVKVIFDPLSDGLILDTVRIDNNDPDEPMANVFLCGNGYVVDTVPGHALHFDGSNNYAKISDNSSLDFTKNYTIEAWIYPESFNWFGGIVTKYQTGGSDGFTLRLSSDSPYTGLRFDDRKTQNGILEANKWYHVAAVNDNGTRYIYLNGVSQSLDGTARNIKSNSDPVCIGVDYLKSPRYFHGDIDEVRIWSYARTEQDIREDMHLTLKGNEPGLVSYYQFNEGTGTTLKDEISGNDAVMHHFSQSDWIVSSIPAGGGSSNTQTVSSTGQVVFTGTGLTMDFTEKTGSDIFVSSRINCFPNVNPAGNAKAYNDQYWIMRKYGSGTYNADIVYTTREDLSTDDETHPGNIRLYQRPGNATGDWVFYGTAASVVAAANTASFDTVLFYGQYLLTGVLHADSTAGTALEFSDNGNHVSFGNSTAFDIASDLTIEAWIKPSQMTVNNEILRKGSNHYLYWDYDLESTSGKGIQLNLDGLSTGWWEFKYDMNYDEWYHVAWTYSSSGELIAYINGDITRTGSFPGIININTDVLMLGSKLGVVTYKGIIDELRIWNIVLDSNQLRQNMYKVYYDIEPGMVGYWQFNAGSGKTAFDETGGNNGTLYLMDDSNWIPSTAPIPYYTITAGNWESDAIWADGQKAPKNDWARTLILKDVTVNSSFRVIEIILDSSAILMLSPGIEIIVEEE